VLSESVFFILVLLPDDLDATTDITSQWHLTSLFIFEDIHQTG